MVHWRWVSPLQQWYAHYALSVQEFLANNGTNIVPRPPHFTDVASRNILLFPKLKLATISLY
jgi:hypothetical protein